MAVRSSIFIIDAMEVYFRREGILDNPHMVDSIVELLGYKYRTKPYVFLLEKWDNMELLLSGEANPHGKTHPRIITALKENGYEWQTFPKTTQSGFAGTNLRNRMIELDITEKVAMVGTEWHECVYSNTYDAITGGLERQNLGDFSIPVFNVRTCWHACASLDHPLGKFAVSHDEYMRKLALSSVSDLAKWLDYK